ncbi:MAG: hypothetical protein M1822_008170 [Bathelium mastoideum]|nr:MAG: hypothetical protein M1822_008170 [Bathelium mastoideum]
MATANGSTRNGAHGVDGIPDPERNAALHTRLKRPLFRALVEDFGPVWFTWCMNAGIIAIILHQFPYQFHGIGVLSTIAFMIDFTLFILFSVIFLLHFALFRRQAWRELIEDPSALGLFASWPIAWMTLVSFIALTVSQASWGGHAFTIVAYVMWWIGAAWVLGTLLFVVIILINRHEASHAKLPPVIIIPTVGVATVATIGGLLSSYALNISARLAVPVIIFSFCVAGIGLLTATVLYTILFHQLFANGWPEPEQIGTMFVFVGPMGQTATALQMLGTAADTFNRFGGYDKGTFLTMTAAMPLDIACILIALMLSGFGVVALILAFSGMLFRLFRRELRWTVSWNAIIFPTGTLTTSMLMFSIEMNSPFFRVITAILLVFLLIVFFVNLGFTAWEIFRGRLLVVRENPRVKKQLQEEQKER